MTTPSAPLRPRTRRWTACLARPLFGLVITAAAQVTSAQGLQVTRNPVADTSSASRSKAGPTALRVLSTRSHMQCPLPGKNTRLLSIDSPREWDDTIEHQDEITALGRKVRWSRERVLVYALESKPYAGVRLDSPSRVIRLAQGVLYWPVRQVMPEMGAEKATVLTRPCVMTTIDRAYWQRIKVVPTRP